MTAATEPTTLSAWLLAQLAADEAEAREALAERKRVRYIEGHSAAEPDFVDFGLDAWPDAGVPAVLVGCERVLAECAALREVVALHGEGGRGNRVCRTCMEGYCPEPEDYPCPTLRALVGIYADRDGAERWL